MKVLMLTPYVTIEGRPEFERNKTGFGYMVMDIAKAVGKKEHVDVLAADTRGNGFEYWGVKFLKRSMITYLLSIFNCLPLRLLLVLRKNYSMSNGTFIRMVFYWLMTGYIRDVIKKEHYDIVHIHGCGFATELWMQVCNKCNQKYIVTLHGLKSFTDTVKILPAGKRYERDFLKRVAEGEFPITVISSGMKRLIEKKYGVYDSKNITVVCNAFSSDFKDFTANSGCDGSIRRNYKIPKTAKVLLYVGNIGENKNQRQMVEAYGLLPESLRNNTWILFCGRPSQDGSFERMVEESPYHSHLILCGSIAKNKISDYYNVADGVVLLSVTEGFGLSLIEGMSCGIPCAMFSDMDAFDDLYNSDCMVAIADRNTQSVSNAIVQLLSHIWDPKEIANYSKKFGSKEMANHYIKVYKSVTNE